MKIWSLALVLAILLCGCGITKPDLTIPTTDATLPTEATQPEETTKPTEDTSHNQPEETTLPQNTEPEGWAPGSVEAQTNGALLSWELPGQRIEGICFMGQDLLVFYNNGIVTKLWLIFPETMEVKVTVGLKGSVSYFQQNWVVLGDTFAYYSKSKNAVIFLNTQLEEIDSILVPNDIRDQIVIARDMKKAYYSNGSAICELNFENGESVVLADAGGYVSDMQILFDDTVLMYRDPWGKAVFLSTQTGRVIGSDSSFDGITTGSDSYFLARISDDYQEYLFGTFGAEQGAFVPDRRLTYQNYLPSQHGVVYHENGGGTVPFDYYDLTTGKRVASMEPDFGDTMWFSRVIEDPTDDYLWFATMDTNSENVKLYRWEYGAMPTDDEQVYTGKRWTEAAPDWEGIAQCRARADDMEEKYGVEILLHREAKVPYGYGIKYLYQVNIIQESLDSLEKELASYPEGFFKTLGTVSKNGKIQISLARMIVTNSDWEYYDSMQYWESGNACVVVQCGDYKTGRLVNRGIGFILETFLKNGGYLETWESCNPEGFEYYGSARDSVRYDYLGHYFIDMSSMTSKSYDVAVIFEHAMMNGTADYFQGDGIQKKMELLCQSIREAFDLTEMKDHLTWEKYLAVTQ